MLAEISNALGSLRGSKCVKVIVFEGAGKHFSFGASVPEHTKDKAGMMLNAFHGMFYALMDLAVPTMAVVRGQCLGGGMELALFCNVIVAGQDRDVRSAGDSVGGVSSACVGDAAEAGRAGAR